MYGQGAVFVVQRGGDGQRWQQTVPTLSCEAHMLWAEAQIPTNRSLTRAADQPGSCNRTPTYPASEGVGFSSTCTCMMQEAVHH